MEKMIYTLELPSGAEVQSYSAATIYRYAKEYDQEEIGIRRELHITTGDKKKVNWELITLHDLKSYSEAEE